MEIMLTAAGEDNIMAKIQISSRYRNRKFTMKWSGLDCVAVGSMQYIYKAPHKTAILSQQEGYKWAAYKAVEEDWYLTHHLPSFHLLSDLNLTDRASTSINLRPLSLRY